jgi:hypothetical protein
MKPVAQAISMAKVVTQRDRNFTSSISISPKSRENPWGILKVFSVGHEIVWGENCPDHPETVLDG